MDRIPLLREKSQHVGNFLAKHQKIHQKNLSTDCPRICRVQKFACIPQKTWYNTPAGCGLFWTEFRVMAKKQTVWGIDIGNTSLKALRCSLAEEPGKVEALACDFIEHSKVLSQPGTDAAEVLAETLQTFLSRNDTKGDRVAISVSGQNTISRFLPLPPVNPKKIPDVIRYEAKQWLPFDINDVVFDFQPLGKPAHDADNTLIDATVGMFAIKRDVATKALAPYLSQSVDIDSIQSSPIALYNFVAFDQLPPPPVSETEEDAAEDDTPQDSLIALCIGTDATDVVITDGTKIWIRNIPLGGNSFTKALTRELQLTFSKAEYLKRNITASKDVDEQKRVITAMRPVFNDMVNEVNRSLEYYQTLNRKAKFQKIVALGNASKLPGLRQFIAQNLGYEVVRLPRFTNLIGSEVTETQLFKDNLYSFAVCYGLAVQQLGISSLKTNLIPREVVMDRIIREKKPWMLAAAAALLLGITIQFAGVTSAYNSVFNDAYERANSRAQSVQSAASSLQSQTSQAVSAFNTVNELGRTLTSNVEGRITWLELFRALNATLPQAQPNASATIVRPTTSANFTRRQQVFITSIEAIPVDSLTEWFAPLQADNRFWPDDEYLKAVMGDSGGDMAGGMMGGMSGGMATSTPSSMSSMSESDGENGDGETLSGELSLQQRINALTEAERFALVVGPGGGGASGGMGGGMGMGGGIGGGGGATAKVVQITGYHYHNPRDPNEFAADGGEAFLRNTLLKQLRMGTVELPPTLEEQQAGILSKVVSMSELGISYPVLLYVPNVAEVRIPNPDLFPLPPGVTVPAAPGGVGGATGGFGAQPMRGQTAGQPTQQDAFTLFAAQRGVREPFLTARRFDFVIQFAWEVTLPSERRQNAESNETATTEETSY